MRKNREKIVCRKTECRDKNEYYEGKWVKVDRFFLTVGFKRHEVEVTARINKLSEGSRGKEDFLEKNSFKKEVIKKKIKKKIKDKNFWSLYKLKHCLWDPKICPLPVPLPILLPD